MNPHLRLERPSAWVARFAPLIPAGEVLDLACGGGRHARLVAELGHRVLAVDRDQEALAACIGSGIHTDCVDLEQDGFAWPFGNRRFAGVVVVNYLHRPLLPAVLESLMPGGILIYDTFASGNQHFGRPANPDFLLQPGELLAAVHGAAADAEHPLRVLAYEDGYEDLPVPAMRQRICVRRQDQAGLDDAEACERLRIPH